MGRKFSNGLLIRYAKTHAGLLLESCLENGWPFYQSEFKNDTESAAFVCDELKKIIHRIKRAGLNDSDVGVLRLYRGTSDSNSGKSAKQAACSVCGAIRYSDGDDGMKCPNCESELE